MRRQKIIRPQEESLFYTVNTSDVMANEPNTDPTRLDHSEPGSPTHHQAPHQASPSVDRVQSRKSPRPVADINAPAFSEPSQRTHSPRAASPRPDIHVEIEPQPPSIDRVQSRKSPRNKSPRSGSGSAGYENVPVSPMVAPTASWATVQVVGVGVGGQSDAHDAMSDKSEQDYLESVSRLLNFSYLPPSTVGARRVRYGHEYGWVYYVHPQPPPPPPSYPPRPA